jgi:hypothetical protein
LTLNGLLILLALWLQGALAMALLWRMGSIRLPLVMGGKIPMGAIALSRDPWPEREKQVSNAFDNQFQLPILLAIAGFAALDLGPTLAEVVLVWVFVITRFVHAGIHITTNHVVHRFAVYTAGFAVLIAIWLELLVRLVLAAIHLGA